MYILKLNAYFILKVQILYIAATKFQFIRKYLYILQAV